MPQEKDELRMSSDRRCRVHATRESCVFRWAITLIVAPLMSGCGSYGSSSQSAPYHYGSGQGYVTGSLGENPVTTELHTYNLDFEDSDEFRVYGSPLRLTFSEKYYGYSTNMEGGPQYYVKLRLDGSTLRAAVDVVRERYGVRTGDEIARKINGEGLGKDFRPGPYRDLIWVDIDKRKAGTDRRTGRMTLETSGSRSAVQKLKADISAHKYSYLGKLCDFDIYGAAKDLPLLKQTAAESDGGELGVAGSPFSGINPDPNSPVLGVACNDHPAICAIYMEHRGFGITVTVNRDRLCAFGPAYQQIPVFIDQHAAFPLPRG